MLDSEAVGIGEAERIAQPVLVVLGGNSEPLDRRFGETYRFLLGHNDGPLNEKEESS